MFSWCTLPGAHNGICGLKPSHNFQDCWLWLSSIGVCPPASSQEIYPPKVNEYAYVTDGACGLADILAMELVICKVCVCVCVCVRACV